MPASSVMVGGITARIQRLPSSSFGRNSVPSRAPSRPQTSRKAARSWPTTDNDAPRSGSTMLIDLADAAAPERSRPPRPRQASRIEDITGVTVKVAMTAPSKRIGIGARHRTEDLAFHALHGEQRQERRDRDDHREEDRPVDLDRRGKNAAQFVGQSLVRDRAVSRRHVVREMAEDVLHHDDGGIDDDAEVDRADRQQIGGFSAQHRDDDGEEQAPPEWSPIRSGRSADRPGTSTESRRSARRRTACCAARSAP